MPGSTAAGDNSSRRRYETTCTALPRHALNSCLSPWARTTDHRMNVDASALVLYRISRILSESATDSWPEAIVLISRIQTAVRVPTGQGSPARLTAQGSHPSKPAIRFDSRRPLGTPHQV